MPTYEYRCQKCHKMFDAVQSMKDAHFKTCPEALCQNEDGWGQGEVTRLMGTGAGLIFKGSGFYITDYRSEGYKEAAKKDTPAPAGDKAGGSEKGSGEKSPAATPTKAADSGSSSAGGSGASSSSPSKPAAGSPPASSGPKT